ncbi:site-specific integrase [Nocardia stercoris]|uniref:Site-specific integrase n=1 Tax=Nocardia stercoris TaxID=2483361 RepID=A0A3M2KTI6_9NOCA|nr:site-specific integrase [Nocardia stercoris]RMI28411.1 site-specific integrase [Nocardia stercoris]
MPARRAAAKSKRRTEPIDKRTAKDGTVTYTFRVDVGTTADGRRDRPRFTYSTLTEARREFRRITTEVADGCYVPVLDTTVDDACEEWLKGRRGIRLVKLEGYRNNLKPVRRRLGGKLLTEVTKADGDDLVDWMLTQGRVDPRHYRPDSLLSRVAAFIDRSPAAGIAVAEVKAAFPDDDVYNCLSMLVRTDRIARPQRGIYAPATDRSAVRAPEGVKPVTVRTTLTTFGMVVQSYVDQGMLPRNVIDLVDRPQDPIDDDEDEDDDEPGGSKSWTAEEVAAFREQARTHRLYACWLLSCYGMRRSEVLAARWTRFNGSRLRIRRGRVAIGKIVEENLPKSRRSRRDLPLPDDVAEALRVLKERQKAEAARLGIAWSEDRLIAVHEDGRPLRPAWYSDEFQRLREHAGLRRIPLKGLRNTSVSAMLARGIPATTVAAWHGHDPAVSLRIYNQTQNDELRAAGATLFTHSQD